MIQGKCINCGNSFISRTKRRKYCIDCQVKRLAELNNKTKYRAKVKKEMAKK